MVIYYFRI